MRIALVLWPDTFEDWYRPLGIDRRYYLEEYDGEWVVSAARALLLAGAELHLVFMTLEEEGVGVQLASGATVHFVRTPVAYRALRQAVWGHAHWERAQRVWPLAPYVSTASRRLFACLRSMRPDVVVVQDYEMPRYDVIATVLPWLGIPFVGLDTGGSSAPSGMPWKSWTARRARALLATHAVEAERVRRERGPRAVAVWPAPVRTDLYDPGDRAAARRRLNLDGEVGVVVSVGRLHGIKGLHDLADACRDLDCELVLVGAGELEGPLRARRQPNLRLTGRLTADEVHEWYLAADVVGLASHQEGQPIAVLEAFTCGRGVVATAVGGVPAVVEDGVTGWCVPPRDVDALHTALAEALADVPEADRRGAEGRRRVIERHAYEPAGRELLRLVSR